jgi:predicted aldo/keto reductase-like oxidoreductase
MEYRIFGDTGIEVSVLGFGCMRLPVLDGDVTRINEELATEMVHHAVRMGVNYFDTAFPYHAASPAEGGASEPFLGRALKGGFREKVHIATKLPAWLVQSPADMDRFLDLQLKRLDSGPVDFYLLHSLNRGSWDKLVKHGVFDFLDRARKSGKIRYAGFSFHDEADLFREILESYEWDFCQIMYNYFDEHFQAGKEGLHLAAKRNVATVVMEPLRGGALADGLPDDAVRILKQSSPERSTVEWAFRWLWKQPEVAITLSGMSDMDQLRENLRLAGNPNLAGNPDRAGNLEQDGKASGQTWTTADDTAIQKVNRILRNRQRVSCTSCGYCMPCPHGVDIPRNFMLSNDHHMLNDKGAKVRYYRLLNESQRASVCIRCGECLEKCPQQIPIPDELEHVVELFES